MYDANKKHAVFKNIATILLFLLILFGLRIVFLHHFGAFDQARIVGGVLDMRGTNMKNLNSIKLNGEWEFYPGKLLSRQDQSWTTEGPRLIQVPGNWSSSMSDGAVSSFGYGTYRLRILIDPLEKPVSFWSRSIETSASVEINGHQSANSGVPATTHAEYTSRNVPFTASYFEKGVTELELLIHVANFDNPSKGGILRSIRFGPQETVESLRWYSMSFQLTTFIILLLHGIYGCVAYLLNPKERTLLLAALFVTVTGLSVLVRHDNLMLTWVHIDHIWAVKLKQLLLIWQTFFILLIFRKFSLASENNRWFKMYTALHVGYSLFLLLGPAPLVYKSIDIGLGNFFYMFPFAWFLYIMGTLLFRRQEDKDFVFILLSVAGILSNMLWSTWNSVADVIVVYYPVDIISAIIGFSAYWFKQYFRNASENRKLNEQLREADRMKDQFLANTSHELRTPLHGIMNIAEAVVTKERNKLEENSLHDMRLLIKISRRMSHMLGDLLDVVRLQEHRIVLKQEPVRLQSIVQGIMSMLKFMIEGKPVELKNKIRNSDLIVMADEKRLVQILYNLVHNALKYTENGTVSVFAESQHGRATIHVSDTGVGMDEETLARIFLPYEQGTYGMNDGRGIGLGLSICKQLVELHGGTLSVFSQPGKGSVFTFELPLAEAQPSDRVDAKPSDWLDYLVPAEELRLHTEAVFTGVAANESAGAEAVPPLLHEEPIHILAVDDDPVNLSVLVGILSAEPYHITTVQSASEVLKLIQTKPWDLLIADVMMPNMSGYELTERIREDYSISKLPVLLLTARSQPEDIYTGFLSGANDYVTKPVDAMELKYRIRALTTLKRSIHEHQRIEAAYLQAQIKPHFLFNTMNSILALSTLDIDRMRGQLEAFASYLRISFDFLNTGELVELSHELELTKAYLHIEKERFPNRLTIEWDVQPGISLRIPPLSIQPLVENALKHGLLGQFKGGMVQIRIARTDDATIIEVRDNGKGMEQETIARILSPTMEGKGGIGLANTNRRLTQRYGKGLQIDSKLNEGTTVWFVVPDGESKNE